MGEYYEEHPFRNMQLQDLFFNIPQDSLKRCLPYLSRHHTIPVWYPEEEPASAENMVNNQPHNTFAHALREVYEVICLATVIREENPETNTVWMERWLVNVYQANNDLYRVLFMRVFFAKMDWTDSFKRELDYHNVEANTHYPEYLLYHEEWMLLNCSEYKTDNVLPEWRNEFVTRFPAIADIYHEDVSFLEEREMHDVLTPISLH